MNSVASYNFKGAGIIVVIPVSACAGLFQPVHMAQASRRWMIYRKNSGFFVPKLSAIYARIAAQALSIRQ
jgi:hypothetical protein